MFKSAKVAIYLAYKSVTRGNYNVLVMSIAIMILVFLNLSFVPSVMEGVVDNLNKKLIDTFSSNITIEPASGKEVIENVSEVTNNISAIDEVKNVTHRYKLPAQASFKGEKTVAEIFAIDVNKDKKVFATPKFMIEGSFLEPDDIDKIVLGVQLSGSDQKNLELYTSSLRSVHVGDKVKVNYGGGLEKEYMVKGIFKTEMILTDKQAYITERELTDINPVLKNQATNLNVEIEKTGDENKVINQIMLKYPEFKYKTWQEIAGLIKNTTDSLGIINNIFKVISLLLAGLTIFIVTYIDLVNKRRQIGVERAIGIQGSSIVGSYIIRAVFYAFVGVYLAYLIFIYIIVPLEARYPFRFPNGPVMLVINQPYLAGNALILIVVAVFSALLPSYRAIKIKILDAIWGI
ncbi:MAG: FtsX-like permease family protein [bacterium]|nr:FtsX-like permease family protein [bacterium]